MPPRARASTVGLIVAAVAFATACGGKARDPERPIADAASDAANRSPGLTLFAGAIGGRGNVDGIGTAARFDAPWALTLDGSNALYVVDANAIRKIDLASRRVTTLAGDSHSAGNDDGAGSDARFSGPQGIAKDAAGNLYVADTLNRTIRTIVMATGAVTTLAGAVGVSGFQDGPGSDARFGDPVDVTNDDAGNLYVADQSNHVVRKIVTATGMVTTLAGSAGSAGYADGTGPGARFGELYGLIYDRAGHLYVLDQGNGIRAVDTTTGTVTTLLRYADYPALADAAPEAGAFGIPTSAVVSTDGSALFVLDSGFETILRVDLATGKVETIAGFRKSASAVPGPHFADGTGTSARFSEPEGLTADPLGNLYVADTVNYTVRQVVVATGVVSTFAGAAPARGSIDGAADVARFSAPTGLASDAAGNLYVADLLSDTIRRIASNSGEVTTLAGTPGLAGSSDGTGSGAGFQGPSGLATDRSGNLYVADDGNNAIRKMVATTGEVTTVVQTPFTSLGGDGMGGATQLNGPRNLASDAAGCLYVTTYDDSIHRVDLATGQVSAFAGAPLVAGVADGIGAEARFAAPTGLALDANGNLYVADSGNATIRRIVIATRAVTTLAGSPKLYATIDGTGAAARFQEPGALAVDGTGNLYVADAKASVIRRIAFTTGIVTTVVGSVRRAGVELGPLPAQLGKPAGLALLPGGDLAVADDQAVLIARF